MNDRQIAFLGLGLMGSRMAANLHAKGFDVRPWSRSGRGVPDGLTAAASVADAVRGAGVIASCVADPAALREVIAAAAPALSPGQLWLDLSTIGPEDARRIAADLAGHGVAFIDAPVTGSKGGAQAATLLIMAGGADADLDRAQPVLGAISARVIRCGPVGAGSQIKIAGNLLIAAMLQGITEGILLTERAGLDPRTLIEVVQASGFRSPYYDFKGQAVVRRDFDTHFSIDLMHKDLSLFLDSARREGVEAPLGGSLEAVYRRAQGEGRGALDITAAGVGPGSGQPG